MCRRFSISPQLFPCLWRLKVTENSLFVRRNLLISRVVNQQISRATPLKLQERQLNLPNPDLLLASTSDVNISDLLPGLVGDLNQNLGGILPTDVPSAIAKVNLLTALLFDVVSTQVDNLLYLPVGFYYGNPLIPLSGTLPPLLSRVLSLVAAIPPIELPAGVTDAITPLRQILSTILGSLPEDLKSRIPPLKFPDPRYPLISVPAITPIAIPTDILQQVQALLPSKTVTAIPIAIPTRAL